MECDQQSQQKLIMHAILGQSSLTQQRPPADGLAQKAKTPAAIFRCLGHALAQDRLAAPLARGQLVQPGPKSTDHLTPYTVGLMMPCSHSNCKSTVILEDTMRLPTRLVSIE